MGGAGGSCNPEGKAVEAALSQPNRDNIATHSLPGYRDPTSQLSSPMVSQSWLPSRKRNLTTCIVDGLHPLPGSRPTSEDPSPHPFLSSLSSPSTASSMEPSRCDNRAGDSDKGDYSGTLVVSRCDCDSDLGFCVEIQSKICLISKHGDRRRQQWHELRDGQRDKVIVSVGEKRR